MLQRTISLTGASPCFMLHRTMSTKAPAKPARRPKTGSAPKAKRPPVSRNTLATAIAPTPLPDTDIQEIPVATQIDTNTDNTQAKGGDTSRETMREDAKAAFSVGNGQMADAMKKTSEMASGMTDMAKGNVEAMVESSRIAATGAQDFAKDMAEYNRRTFEHVTAAMKEMTQAKSPTELFKLQSEYAQKLFDLAIAETSRTTESMMKLAGEVSRPVQNQIAEATAKVRGQ